jgi:hypothetical protein
MSTSTSRKNSKSGSKVLLSIGMAVALILIVFPLAPKLMKTASQAGAILSSSPPAEMLDSKLHMMVDGRSTEFSSNSLREIASDLESRGCMLSWSDGDLGSWILAIARHDRLTGADHETRVQLLLRDGRTIVTRGVLDGRTLSEAELSVIINVLSGDLERAMTQQQQGPR